jgi:hypothetical protein
MQARSPRRIVRRKVKCTGFTAGYRMTLEAAPSRFAPKMMAAECKALWRFSALGRHIGETMQSRSPRRIVGRKAKCTPSSQDIA